MRTHLLSLALLLCLGLSAQTRYLQPIFTGVITQTDSTVYQRNITIEKIIRLQSPTPTLEPDYFQAYMPAGDSRTDRPCIILNTTGSFLPQFIGGGIFGTLKDSAVVNVAKRFAQMGYVAIIAEYRLGWIPTAGGSPAADDQRIGTLLTAAYRGIQDARSLARYLRKSVQDGNALGIDPTKIGIIGFGTGGYNAFNTNFLDSSSEVFAVPKFYSPNTGNSYLDTALVGNPNGTQQKQLNIPNNLGFDSRFQFAAGIGGALGDTSWIDGNILEAPTVGIHSTTDLNAPYSVGDVFVPAPGGTRLFVINAHGARATIGAANRRGVNDELDALNAALLAANDFLTVRSKRLETVPFTTRDGVQTTFTTENMYAFVHPSGSNIANTYNYIDSTQLVAAVNAFRMTSPDTTTAATYLRRERAGNPNITNRAAANRSIDTIMNFIVPRAFVAMSIGTAQEVIQALSITDIEPAQVGLEIFPNPMSSSTTIRVKSDVQIQLFGLYDNAGRQVLTQVVNGSQYELNRDNLPSGVYTLFVQTDQGLTAQRVMVQ